MNNYTNGLSPWGQSRAGQKPQAVDAFFLKHVSEDEGCSHGNLSQTRGEAGKQFITAWSVRHNM